MCFGEGNIYFSELLAISRGGTRVVVEWRAFEAKLFKSGGFLKGQLLKKWSQKTQIRRQPLRTTSSEGETKTEVTSEDNFFRRGDRDGGNI